MMIAPERSPPGFGSAVKLITPPPVPLVGAVSEIQFASLVAVHAHSASVVVTVTVDAPPLVAMVWVAGVSV
jgi:hypothetical protein